MKVRKDTHNIPMGWAVGQSVFCSGHDGFRLLVRRLSGCCIVAGLFVLLWWHNNRCRSSAV